MLLSNLFDENRELSQFSTKGLGSCGNLTRTGKGILVTSLTWCSTVSSAISWPLTYVGASPAGKLSSVRANYLLNCLIDTDTISFSILKPPKLTRLVNVPLTWVKTTTELLEFFGKKPDYVYYFKKNFGSIWFFSRNFRVFWLNGSHFDNTTVFGLSDNVFRKTSVICSTGIQPSKIGRSHNRGRRP